MTLRSVCAALLGAAVALHGMTSLIQAADAPKELLAYFGTYTNGGKSKGIYCYKLDLASGKLTSVGVTEGIKNPSFLAIHPTGKFLYAVSEVNDADGKPGGAATAFSLDRKTGELKTLHHQSSEGHGPSYVATDKRGPVPLAANYGRGR